MAPARAMVETNGQQWAAVALPAAKVVAAVLWRALCILGWVVYWLLRQAVVLTQLAFLWALSIWQQRRLRQDPVPGLPAASPALLTSLVSGADGSAASCEQESAREGPTSCAAPTAPATAPAAAPVSAPAPVPSSAAALEPESLAEHEALDPSPVAGSACEALPSALEEVGRELLEPGLEALTEAPPMAPAPVPSSAAALEAHPPATHEEPVLAPLPAGAAPPPVEASSLAVALITESEVAGAEQELVPCEAPASPASAQAAVPAVVPAPSPSSTAATEPQLPAAQEEPILAPLPAAAAPLPRGACLEGASTQSEAAGDEQDEEELMDESIDREWVDLGACGSDSGDGNRPASPLGEALRSRLPEVDSVAPPRADASGGAERAALACEDVDASVGAPPEGAEPPGWHRLETSPDGAESAPQ